MTLSPDSSTLVRRPDHFQDQRALWRRLVHLYVDSRCFSTTSSAMSRTLSHPGDAAHVVILLSKRDPPSRTIHGAFDRWSSLKRLRCLQPRELQSHLLLLPVAFRELQGHLSTSLLSFVGISASNRLPPHGIKINGSCWMTKECEPHQEREGCRGKSGENAYCSQQA